MRPMPPPMGTVQPLPLGAVQSAVRMGELARYQPRARLTFTNGWMSMAFTLRPPSPANDQTLLASTPATRGPRVSTATAAGPALQRWELSCTSDAEGITNVGPRPNCTGLLLRGTRKTVGLMSPMPITSVLPARGRWITGTMVRDTSNQSSLRRKGMTGCTFTTLKVRLASAAGSTARGAHWLDGDAFH